MTVQDLHYDFKIKLNKIDSKLYDNLRVPEIDWLLNEAEDVFIKTRYTNINNVHKYGFEVTQKRIDDLRTIVQKDIVLSPFIPLVNEPNAFEVSLPLNYKYLIRVFANATKGSCNVSRIPMVPISHDDLSFSLEDPYYKSSFEWREIIYNQYKDKIVVYTDGTFTLNNLVIDYIREPLKIGNGQDFPGGFYFETDGVTTAPANQTSELPDSTHSEIVDLAVLIATGNLGSSEIEYKKLKTQINE